MNVNEEVRERAQLLIAFSATLEAYAKLGVSCPTCESSGLHRVATQGIYARDAHATWRGTLVQGLSHGERYSRTGACWDHRCHLDELLARYTSEQTAKSVEQYRIAVLPWHARVAVYERLLERMARILDLPLPWQMPAESAP